MDVGTYKNDKYTAYFYEHKIVICTSQQCFKIRHFNSNKKSYELKILRELIESGKIDRLDKIRDFNGLLTYENTSKPCLK